MAAPVFVTQAAAMLLFELFPAFVLIVGAVLAAMLFMADRRARDGSDQ